MNIPELTYDGKLPAEYLLNKNNIKEIQLVKSKVYIGTKENDWQNLIFSGDNLEFLKQIYLNKNELIKDKIKGKVKLIYIDPPFGTGQEYKGNKGQNGYSAKSRGAEFIEFIRQRLIYAKEILAEDGFIFVRQAYNFGHYIKIILDEVFGIDNFKNEIIISRKRQSMGTDGKFEVQNESLFTYSKNPGSKLKNIYTKRPLANFKWTGFIKQEVRNPRERKFFGKTLTPPDNQHFSLIQEKVDKLIKEHYLRLKCKDCGAIYYYDENESGLEFFSNKKIKKEKFKYLDLTSEHLIYGITSLGNCQNCSADNFKVEYLPSDDLKLDNIWLDIPSYTSFSGYPTENSEELLLRVTECSTEENDLVMDFFGGSGTTMVAAEKLNRRWIYCDFGKLAVSVFIKRILFLGEITGFQLIKASDKNSMDNEHKKYSQNIPPAIDSSVYAIGDVVKLKIRSFISADINSENQNNFISSILVDKSYSGDVFEIDKIISFESVNNKDEISLGNIDEFSEKAAISFFDIHGNEKIEIYQV